MCDSTPVYLYTKSRTPFHFIRMHDYYIIDEKGIKSYYSKCYIIACVNGTLKTIMKSLITSVVEDCKCVDYITDEFKTAVMTNIFG